MRHQVRKGRKFNRSVGHRKSLLRNLLTSLLENDGIETTLPKAKELKSFSDRVISRAKKAGLSSRRKIFSLITKKSAAEKLFAEIVPRYAERVGGYTKIVKIGRRFSDGSEKARIELIKEENADKKS